MIKAVNDDKKKVLFKSKVIKDTEGYTPFLRSVSRGYYDNVKYFIDECKVNLNERANDGNTAILLAASQGSIDVHNK